MGVVLAQGFEAALSGVLVEEKSAGARAPVAARRGDERLQPSRLRGAGEGGQGQQCGAGLSLCGAVGLLGVGAGAHPLAVRHQAIDGGDAHAERRRHELRDVPLHRCLRHGDR